jgi:hypothetical protein
VPEWLVVILTGVMVVALLGVTWALWFTFQTHRAVSAVNDKLSSFTRSKLIREVVLWIAQSTLAVIGILSFIPRTTTTRMVSNWGVVTLALAVAVMSFLDVKDLRTQVNGTDLLERGDQGRDEDDVSPTA